MSKPTILITGGAGFIGSMVNKMLYEEGFRTIVLDNLTTGNEDAVVHGTLIRGDIGDRTILESIFAENQIEAVLHFAASLDVDESMHNPNKYYRNNVTYTLNLVETMLDFSVNKILFSSSAAVYGNPISLPITEEHPLNPINPYGKSKRICEEILRDFGIAYGLNSIIFRYFNAAGGDPDGEIRLSKKCPHNLIPKILASLEPHEAPLILYGDDYDTPDGSCVRDYIHVWDLAKAHVLALKKLLSGKEFSIYNLGNEKGFSVLEALHATEKVLSVKVPFSLGERREGDPPGLVADSSKARKELGWEPRYPDLERMIQHAYEARKATF